MKRVLRHVILAPFALAILVAYLPLKALDWATSEPVIGSLRDELRSLYR